MTHCCSQCSFTAKFESALMMHRQLHHHQQDLEVFPNKGKSNTLPYVTSLSPVAKESKVFKLAGRTSSATRLFDKLRARICKSKILFSHPEENVDSMININDTSAMSEGTSKAHNIDSPVSRDSALTTCLREAPKETYGCHICSFDADRITALDRHLLNDHKIGLENLLKLVLAKTKDGLAENDPSQEFYGIRQPYYRQLDEIIEEGEFVIETVTPKIKILKHAATNTDIQWTDIPDLKNNCRMITKELEKLMNYPLEKCDKNDFLAKMQVLSECMCKFVDSSNTLKKALTKEFDSKHTVRENLSGDQQCFELNLGEDTPRDWERAHSEKVDRNRNKYEKCRDTPREWERAHSEKVDRNRNKYEKCRGDKKQSSESFYF